MSSLLSASALRRAFLALAGLLPGALFAAPEEYVPATPAYEGFFAGSPLAHGVDVVEVGFRGEVAEERVAVLLWPDDPIFGERGTIARTTARPGAMLPLRRLDTPTSATAANQTGTSETGTWGLRVAVGQGRDYAFRVGTLPRAVYEAGLDVGPGDGFEERSVEHVRSGDIRLRTMREVTVEPMGDLEPSDFALCDARTVSALEWVTTTDLPSGVRVFRAETPPGPWLLPLCARAPGALIFAPRNGLQTPLGRAWLTREEVLAYPPDRAPLDPPRFVEEDGVWLPLGYAQNTDRRYPLLICDAIDEDPKGIVYASLAAEAADKTGASAEIVLYCVQQPSGAGRTAEEWDTLADRVDELRARYRIAEGARSVGWVGVGADVSGWGDFSGPFFGAVRRLGLIGTRGFESWSAEVGDGARAPLLFFAADDPALLARLVDRGYIPGYDLQLRSLHEEEAPDAGAYLTEMLWKLFPAGDLFLREGGRTPAQRAADRVKDASVWLEPKAGETVTYRRADGTVERVVVASAEASPESAEPGTVMCEVGLSRHGTILPSRPVPRRWMPSLDRFQTIEEIAVGERQFTCVVVEEEDRGHPVLSYYAPDCPAMHLVRQVSRESGETIRELIAFSFGKAAASERVEAPESVGEPVAAPAAVAVEKTAESSASTSDPLRPTDVPIVENE